MLRTFHFRAGHFRAQSRRLVRLILRLKAKKAGSLGLHAWLRPRVCRRTGIQCKQISGLVLPAAPSPEARSRIGCCRRIWPMRPADGHMSMCASMSRWSVWFCGGSERHGAKKASRRVRRIDVSDDAECRRPRHHLVALDRAAPPRKPGLPGAGRQSEGRSLDSSTSPAAL